MQSVRRGRRYAAATLFFLAACGRETTAPASHPIASLAVSPTGLLLQVGQTKQLVATARDGSGQILRDREITWRTDSPAVALVNEHGLVTATGPGYVTIIAEAEGKSFGVAATVELPEGTLDENDGANE